MRRGIVAFPGHALHGKRVEIVETWFDFSLGDSVVVSAGDIKNVALHPSQVRELVEAAS